MKNNPFAKVFRTAFEQDVLSDAICVFKVSEYPEKQARVSAFLGELNRFLRANGEAPLLYQKYVIDEKKILEYALFLRGYMRDSQAVIANLLPQHAADQGVIDLFSASSKYVVACNHQFGNKKVFDNNVDYRFWKVETTAQNSEMNLKRVENINPNRRNMFLFMPFRIKDNETELQKWLFKNMQNSMNNQHVFGQNVDVYASFFPIQKSRASNIYSLLKTIKNPESYLEPTDMKFAQKYWKDFVGKNLTFNEKGEITSGEKFSESELMQRFSDISIFAYCSGAANAHRCLNALYNISKEMYGEDMAQKAMQNIEVLTYGFLPLQKHLRYSGVHFYTNAVSDENRHEPFVNLNNHLLYEKTKCEEVGQTARYSVMPDGRNFIVSLQMPENMVIWKNNQPEPFKDKEHGHNILFLTKENVVDKNNYAYHLFRSVFEQVSMGKRGRSVLSFSSRANMNNVILNSCLKGKMQRI